MSGVSYARARAYNQRQDLTSAERLALAQATGNHCPPWTDAALDAVAAWQAAQGLAPDAMVGDSTKRALISAPAVAPKASAARPASSDVPLVTKSPASGSGHYDHAYDPADPSRGGWPKEDAQWEAVTATGSWLAGMLRLLTGRQVSRGGRVTYSRGPDDFITLDTYSLGIAHWWAGTAPKKLLGPLASRFPDEAAQAWGARASILRDPAAMEKTTGAVRGHRRFDESRLRWLLNGWWAVARRPHWLAAQCEVWASDYISDALKIASAQGVVWDRLSAEDQGMALAGIARMANSSPVMARDVLRRFWGGRGDIVDALKKAYQVERSAGGYSIGGNGPGRLARIEAMCAVAPGEDVLDGQWAAAVASGLDLSVAPQRARGV